MNISDIFEKNLRRFRDSLEFRTGTYFENPKQNFFNVRRQIINEARIRTFIDVGANYGQWYSMLGKEINGRDFWAFEPLPAQFRHLRNEFGHQTGFNAVNLAVSDFTGEARLHVASNKGASSSLLKPSNHLKLNQEILFPDQILVKTITLDDFFLNQTIHEPIYLKLDVQGQEAKVINGAQKFLKGVKIIELESSMSSQYQDETEHHELMSKIKSYGFVYFCGSRPRRDSSGREWDLNSLLVSSQLID